MEIATIGFTRTTARSFFTRIKNSQIPLIGDVRLNNTSQLAGFAKRDDLPYFLETLCGARYLELPQLAPEEALLKSYRAKRLSWLDYAAAYLDGLSSRRVQERLDPTSFENGVVLLCSEDEAELCHRRLAAEYLRSCWGDVSIRHL